MVEIPEHLRKRAEEARAKAEAAKGGSSKGEEKETETGADTSSETPVSSGDEKIPSHLLDRVVHACKHSRVGEPSKVSQV